MTEREGTFQRISDLVPRMSDYTGLEDMYHIARTLTQ